MCRNIKTLHNFKPPATEEEIRASAIQFVRKLSGFNRPSKTNEAACNHAVDEVTRVATELLDSLDTNAPPRDREAEAAKAKARTALRCRGAPAVCAAWFAFYWFTRPLAGFGCHREVLLLRCQFVNNLSS